MLRASCASGPRLSFLGAAAPLRSCLRKDPRPPIRHAWSHSPVPPLPSTSRRTPLRGTESPQEANCPLRHPVQPKQVWGTAFGTGCETAARWVGEPLLGRVMPRGPSERPFVFGPEAETRAAAVPKAGPHTQLRGSASVRPSRRALLRQKAAGGPFRLLPAPPRAAPRGGTALGTDGSVTSAPRTTGTRRVGGDEAGRDGLPCASGSDGAAAAPRGAAGRLPARARLLRRLRVSGPAVPRGEGRRFRRET